MYDIFGVRKKSARLVIIAAFYAMALLVYIGPATGYVAPLYNPMAGLIIILGFAVLLPILFMVERGGTALYAVRFVVLHIMAAMVIIYVAGANNPYNVYWVLVMVMSYIALGVWAFLISSTTFFMATLYFNVYTPDLPGTAGRSGLIVAGSLIAFFITFCAYVLVQILSISRNNQRKLTQARKLEKAQFHKLDTLINSLSDTVLTVSTSGKVTSQNAAALVFFDTNESLIGQNIDKLLTLTDSEGKVQALEKLLKTTHTTTIREDLIQTGGEENIRLRLQMAPISKSYGEKSRPGFVIILRDITKQKTLEEEKDEFISVTSHELRTPITIAEGSLSNLMFMQDKGADSKILQKAADEAHKQVIYLARMINDLSTLSRAERGIGDALEDINSYELLQELFMRYSPEAEAKSLHLNLDVPANLPHVLTSRLYLEEILQNFITNAIKYTQAGGVTIEASQTKNGVEFAVSDSGIGISKSDQEKVYDKFYRSEDYRTRETGGTGLGLYVVRKLAHKLGIEVKLKSRLNHGSTFSFTLPANT